METEKNLVVLNDDDEDEAPLSPEEKAAEEKASRRHWYICARVSAANLTERIEEIESGNRVSTSPLNNLETLRRQLAHSRMRISQLEAEFVNDPEVEHEVQLELQALNDIARAFHKAYGQETDQK